MISFPPRRGAGGTEKSGWPNNNNNKTTATNFIPGILYLESRGKGGRKGEGRKRNWMEFKCLITGGAGREKEKE